MVLIADSGSSKTDWRLIGDEDDIQQFKTNGFNPYYISSEEIFEDLSSTLSPQINDEISSIYFYGAGCVNEEKNAIISNALHELFGDIDIFIATDLVAAARALCGNEEGIACILGTGANSCFFDGSNISRNIRAFGYILGDEGSGAYLGTQLIKSFLREEMPEKLRSQFVKRYDIDSNQILENVYNKPFPNKYLGSFTRFMYHHQKDPFIYQMIYDGFKKFFDQYLAKYENLKNHKVHFVGSIAFYFSNILRQVANDQGVTVKNILESPIAGLTLYHQNRMM